MATLSFCPAQLNACATEYSVVSFDLAITDDAGDPVDLTGLDIEIRWSRRLDGPGSKSLTRGSGLTVNDAAGTIAVSTTMDFGSGSFVWDLWIGGMPDFQGNFQVDRRVPAP
jgi:predicted secreted protein